MKIAILGAGAFGTALGGILADNGYDIDYYDPKFEKENLSSVLDGAAYILLASPSSAAPYLLPHLPKDVPMIIATKGFLNDKQFLTFDDYMVISGPGFADDIKAGKNTYFTITDKKLKDLFGADYISFDYTNDTCGVLMCGALKNIYAIQAGILGLKRNSLSWKEYIINASSEIKTILSFNGASEKTMDLYCGIFDLELTCGYPSRNYEYGDLLRRDNSYIPVKTVEGLAALKRIKRGEIKVPDDAFIIKNLMERF